MNDSPDRLRWFAGNASALDLYERLVFVAHAWDDLIDQDKPVDVNALMETLLLYLPGNACYRKFEPEIRALMMAAMVSYQAANVMERECDAHQLELAHYLRYGVMNVAIFLIGALNGVQQGAEIVAQAAPFMVPERLSDYLLEHAKP